MPISRTLDNSQNCRLYYTMYLFFSIENMWETKINKLQSSGAQRLGTDSHSLLTSYSTA